MMFAGFGESHMPHGAADVINMLDSIPGLLRIWEVTGTSASPMDFEECRFRLQSTIYNAIFRQALE